MRANTGFHADRARRHIGEPGFDLAARPPLAQDDRAALIQTDDVERVLADIDANDRNRGIRLLGHGMLLVFGAPCQQGRSTAGPSHSEIASLQFDPPAIEVEPTLAVQRPACPQCNNQFSTNGNLHLIAGVRSADLPKQTPASLTINPERS
jgi:hypothetical protein